LEAGGWRLVAQLSAFSFKRSRLATARLDRERRILIEELLAIISTFTAPRIPSNGTSGDDPSAHLTHSLKTIRLVIDTLPTGPQEERALAAPLLIEVNDLRGGLKQDLEYPLDPPIHQQETDRQNGQGDTLQNIDNELFSHRVVNALALAETKK
jgi:hypothetical protein